MIWKPQTPWKGAAMGLVLWLVAPLAAECIPEGSGRDLEFARPPLPAGQDTQHPSHWADRNGQPEAQEVDPFRNDSMGPATPTAHGARTTITNRDGDLLDAQGQDQNGFGEGPCIEVRICWTAWIYETRLVYSHLEMSLADGPAGSILLKRRQVTKYWRTRVCSRSVEACPEGAC
ncbi:MAG TPA: hypothetical protein PLJ12_03735 [Planctomycetota bacterium]|nr:hypothetical protein [Planctomycetota bacterium]